MTWDLRIVGGVGTVGIGAWGLYVCYGILQEWLGTTLAIIGIVVLPVGLVVAPFYEGIVNGNWVVVLILYGGSIGTSVLFAIASKIDDRN